MQSLREKLFGPLKPLREKLATIKSAVKEVYAPPEEREQIYNAQTAPLLGNEPKPIPPEPVKTEENTLVPQQTIAPKVETSATPIAPQQPTQPVLGDVIDVKDRGIKVDKKQIESTLKPMLYSEVASFLDRPKDKVELEIRTVVNTVLNRMKDWGGSVEEIVKQPKQYQGVGSKKYEAFGTTTDVTEKKQISLINEVVDKIIAEIESGSFVDNVAGAVFYGHAKDGTIRAFDTWDEYAAAIAAGKIK
jgi:Cell Wall Hydrolase